MSDLVKQQYKKMFAKANGHAGDAVWLRHLREQALTEFSQQEFPHRKQEAWRYTQVDPLLAIEFSLLEQKENLPSAEQIAPYKAVNSYSVVFINGQLCASLSDLTVLPQGVRVQELAQALLTMDADKQAVLQAPKQQHIFHQLNTAFIGQGVWIELADGVSLTKPLQLLFLATSEQTAWVSHPRIITQLGKQASLTLLEDYCSTTAMSYFNNIMHYITLAPESRLACYRLQHEGSRAFHLATTELHLAQGSVYNGAHLALGGRLARHEYAVTLASDSQCKLQGLLIAKGSQHIDQNIVLDHQQPQVQSQVDYRAVADDKSRVVFNGKIIVQPLAQKANAQLTNHNLLLSDQAEIDTKPELEIYADDVKCAHGATVGQLDEEAWFYLRSRGIDKATARKILIAAFTQVFTDSMPEGVAEPWQAAIRQQLTLPATHKE